MNPSEAEQNSTGSDQATPVSPGHIPAMISRQDLRRHAEEKVRAFGNEDPQALSLEAVRQLVHELRVHQIELEMQNEELRRAQMLLDDARSRYFDLYDLAPVGYLTFSGDGKILEANLAAASLLGLTRGDLVRRQLSRFILPEDQDIFYRHRKQLFETGEPQLCEMRLVRKDDAPLWARLRATRAQDEDGETRYRCVLSDISEPKLAEELLHESERRYRSLFEDAPIGLYRITADGDFLDVNQALVQMLGYPDKAALLAVRTSDTYADAGDRLPGHARVEGQGVAFGLEINITAQGCPGAD